MKAKRFSLLVALALCAVLTFTACGNDDKKPVQPQHEHSYTYSVTQEATCEHTGTNTGVCSCGHTVTEIIPVTDHVYETVTQEAACEKAGYEKKVCKFCGNEADYKTIPALEHDYQWEIIDEATCVADGFKKGVCSHCHNEETAIITKTGVHTYGGWATTEPTCTSAGHRERTCTECGNKEEEVLNAKGHSYEWTVTKEVTCLEDGARHGVCSACGVERDEVLQHTEAEHELNGEWTVTKQPTCGEAGAKTQTCTRCHQVITESIDATGEHSYGDWEHTVPSTCSQEGVDTRTCTECGHIDSKAAALKAHTYGDYEVTAEPNCTAEGTEVRTCSVCGATDSRKIATNGAHTYGAWVITTRPAADKTGVARAFCAHNQEHYVSATLPALNSDDYTVKTVEFEDGGVAYTSYTYVTEHGDISFNESSAPTSTIADAIALAKKTQTQIISSDINYKTSTSYSGTGSDDAQSTDVNVTNTFKYGKDFLHFVNTSEKEDVYVNKQADGTYFGVYFRYNADGEKVLMNYNATQEEMAKLYSGYGYRLTHAQPSTNAPQYYGIAEYLDYLYDCALADVNNDFTQSANNGVYKFSFGFRDVYESRNLFHTIQVQFSLNEDYIINSAEVKANSYVIKTLVSSTPDPSNPNGAPIQTYRDTGYVEKTADGYWRLTSSARWKNQETFAVTQESRYGVGEHIPESPYPRESLLLTSFDFNDVERIYDEVSGSETFRDLGPSPESREIYPLDVVRMAVRNAAPENANLYVDPVIAYLRDEQGNLVPLQKTYEGGNDGHITFNFNSATGEVVLNFYVAGDFVIVLKTDKITKEMPVKVNWRTPGKVNRSVAKFVPHNDEYVWSQAESSYEVYANQKLYFGISVEHPAYERVDYTASAKKDSQTAENVITDAEFNGKQVKAFSAAQTGKYTVTITTANNIVVDFTVTVKEIPAEQTIFGGVYKNSEDDPDVCADFKNGKFWAARFDITEEDPITFEYAFNAETREITLSNVQNFKNSADELQFMLDDGYNMFVLYNDSFGKQRKVYVNNIVINNIVGTYELMSIRDDAIAHAVNVEGEYTIKLSSNSGYGFYRISDADDNGTNTNFKATSVTVNLKKGDVLRVWHMMSSGQSYTIICNDAEQIAVTGVTLDKQEAEAWIGGDSITLTAKVAPANATNVAVTWSSSNTKVATVVNGVVTAVGEGTAVITVTTEDGGFTAACNVTISKKTSYAPGDAVVVPTIDGSGFDAIIDGKAGNTYKISASKGGMAMNRISFTYGEETGAGSLTFTLAESKVVHVFTYKEDDPNFTVSDASIKLELVTDIYGATESGSGTEFDPYVISKGGRFVNTHESYSHAIIYTVTVAAGGKLTVTPVDAFIEVNSESIEAAAEYGAGEYTVTVYPATEESNDTVFEVAVETGTAPVVKGDIELGVAYELATDKEPKVFVGEAGKSYNVHAAPEFGQASLNINGTDYRGTSFTAPADFTVTADEEGKITLINIGYAKHTITITEA